MMSDARGYLRAACLVAVVGLLGFAEEGLAQARRTADRFARPVGRGVEDAARPVMGTSRAFSVYAVNRLPGTGPAEEVVAGVAGIQVAEPALDPAFSGHGQPAPVMARYYPGMRTGQGSRCTPSRANLLAPARPVVVQRGGEEPAAESWGQGVAVPSRGYLRGPR